MKWKTADPGNRDGQPDYLGGSRFPHDRGQRRGRLVVPHRSLRRRQAGRRSLGAPVQGLLPRQEDRENSVGSNRVQRRAEGEAAHEVDAGQLHTGHGWQARRRRVRERGSARRVRPRRQGALARGSRSPRQRLVLRSDLPVGALELAGHLQELRDRPGRRPEGLVPCRMGPDDRQAALEDGAR